MARRLSKFVTTIGTDEVKRKLEGLEAKVQKHVLRPAVKAGAEVIAAEAKRLAPHRTGKLAESIDVKAATKLRNRTAVGYRVLAGDGEYIGDTFYGYFYEFGYFKQPTIVVDGKIKSLKRGHGKPTWQPPRPFMRPALDNMREAAASAVQETAAQILSGIL